MNHIPVKCTNDFESFHFHFLPFPLFSIHFITVPTVNLIPIPTVTAVILKKIVQITKDYCRIICGITAIPIPMQLRLFLL